MRTLDAAHRHVLAAIEPALNRLYDQMVEQLAGGDKIPPSWLYEANRLTAIKKLISQEMTRFAVLSQMQVSSLKRIAADLGTQAATEFLHATKPPDVSWSFGVPNPKAIADLVATT